MKRFLLPVAALAVSVAAAVLAISVGSAADAGGRRILSFEAGTLQSVVSGTGLRKSTNYVLDYKVTNATDAAARPRIRVEVRTDTNKTHGDAYDTAAAAAASKGLRLDATPRSTAALRGEDLAAGASASAMACFGTIDPHADVIEVRVYGLNDRVFRDRQGRIWAENRVLVLTYDRPGDEFDRHLDPVTFRGAREIVDGDPVQLNAKP